MEPARISANELKRRLDSGEPLFLIDTRSPESWKSSRVQLPHSVRVHFSELGNRLAEIPRDRAVVAYCT
jgi:rhodanese-related sulfurtransferase